MPDLDVAVTTGARFTKIYLPAPANSRHGTWSGARRAILAAPPSGASVRSRESARPSSTTARGQADDFAHVRRAPPSAGHRKATQDAERQLLLTQIYAPP